MTSTGSQILFAFQLPRRMYWLLEESGPSEVSLCADPNLFLLTPFGFPQRDFEVDSCIRVKAGNLVSTNHLILIYRNTAQFDERDLRTINGMGSRIASHLRYLSRQFDISSNFSSMSRRADVVETTDARLDTSKAAMETFIRDYFVPTAVTMKHVMEVACAAEAFEIPVHADVMLDALRAHIDQDFRKSILYAAIAAETLASTYLSNEYDVLLGAVGTAPNTRHRVVQLPGEAGGTVLKDPIYEQLSSSRSSFSQLIHERPLYLVGRSLLVENPEAYREALQLYRTRSKISHQGTSALDGKCFEETIDGSLSALRAASRILAWFGDPGPYHPWEGFVWAHNGEMAHRVAR